MLSVSLETEGLLRIGRSIDKVSRSVPSALSIALNSVGTNVVRETASLIAEQTGLELGEVMNLINVKRASPGNLIWEMDASRATINNSTQWRRPFAGRDDSTFQRQTLLKIVTMDDNACEVCKQAEEDSPYTVEEINDIAAKWSHFIPATPVTGTRTNLIHPNCRCSTVPFSYNKRMETTFSQGASTSEPRALTPAQIAKAVAEALPQQVKIGTTG